MMEKLEVVNPSLATKCLGDSAAKGCGTEAEVGGYGSQTLSHRQAAGGDDFASYLGAAFVGHCRNSR